MHTVNDVVDGVERLRNQPLSQEERDEVELWHKGRALNTLVNQPAWDVLREMLQSYATNAIHQSLLVQPGDNERVLAAHAVAYALNDFVSKFFQDVQTSIDESVSTPEALKQSIRMTSPEAGI